LRGKLFLESVETIFWNEWKILSEYACNTLSRCFRTPEVERCDQDDNNGRFVNVGAGSKPALVVTQPQAKTNAMPLRCVIFFCTRTTPQGL